jgi:hypothetical protein
VIVTVERKVVSDDGETVTLYCRSKEDPETVVVYTAPADTLVDRVVSRDGELVNRVVRHDDPA